MFSNDDLLQYLQLNPQAAPATAPQGLDLGAALGVTPQAAPPPAMPQVPPTPPPAPIGAAPDLGVGGLTGPGPMPPMAPPPPAAPQMAKPPKPTPITAQSLASLRDQAYGQQAAGIQAEAAAKEHQALVGGQAELTAAQELAKRQQQDQEVTAAAQKDAADKTAALRQEVDALGNTKVDPNRLVANTSTFGKITSVIALGLGGAFAAKTGKANPMLEMIQGQINKDIQSQMANIETKKAGLSAKGTLLQQEIAQGRDAAEARAKATAALYDTSIREVNAQMKMMGTETAAAEGQQLIGQLTGAKEKEMAAFHQQEVSNGIAAGHLQLAKQQAGVENALKFAQLPGQLAEQPVDLAGKVAETQLKQAQAAAVTAKSKGGIAAGLNPDRAIGNIGQPEIGPNGQPTGRMTWGAVEAPLGSKEQVGKVSDKIGEITPVMQALDAQIKDAKQLGIATKLGASVAGEGVSNIIQRMNARKVQLLQLEHMLAGRVTEQGLDELKKAAGDPTAFLSRVPKMQEFREQIRNQAQAALGSVGIKDRWEPPSPDSMGVPGEQENTIPRYAPFGKMAPAGLPPLGADQQLPGAMVWPPPEWGLGNMRGQ